jgi:hypothetical protein
MCYKSGIKRKKFNIFSKNLIFSGICPLAARQSATVTEPGGKSKCSRVLDKGERMCYHTYEENGRCAAAAVKGDRLCAIVFYVTPRGVTRLSRSAMTTDVPRISDLPTFLRAMG